MTCPQIKQPSLFLCSKPSIIHNCQIRYSAGLASTLFPLNLNITSPLGSESRYLWAIHHLLNISASLLSTVTTSTTIEDWPLIILPVKCPRSSLYQPHQPLHAATELCLILPQLFADHYKCLRTPSIYPPMPPLSHTDTPLLQYPSLCESMACSLTLGQKSSHDSLPLILESLSSPTQLTPSCLFLPEASWLVLRQLWSQR